jgi:hypothetical protein
VMVILPLLFVSARHPLRSLVVVVVASLWAGISRINWFPVPAMLAVAIYLLEEPVLAYQDLAQYLKLPALWGAAGLVSALAAQIAYIPLSGNAANLEAFTSSLTADKLWYRLWPNGSYPLGVLPAILLVSGPLLIVWLLALRGRLPQLHPLRRFGLAAMLLALFAGGLVVSVKIGGGGDLHNMDAYAVLSLLVAAFLIGGRAQSENTARGWGSLAWPVSAIALVIPLFFLIPSLKPTPGFHEKMNQAALLQLKTLAEQAGQNGPVLFLDQRHLLTFHQIDLPLVPDYEEVTLMEMAMSNNQPYLNRFYSDLKNHRFAAIVAGKQNVGFKEDVAFSDENNVWNTRVSPYILCYYEPGTELQTDEGKLEFFTPRAVAGSCP